MWPLVLAGAGLLKGMTVDKAKEDRDVELAAATQRYSPWTGLKAGNIHRADPMGQAIQGGASGLAMQQNQEMVDAYKKNPYAKSIQLAEVPAYDGTPDQMGWTARGPWSAGRF